MASAKENPRRRQGGDLPTARADGCIRDGTGQTQAVKRDCGSCLLRSDGLGDETAEPAFFLFLPRQILKTQDEHLGVGGPPAAEHARPGSDC